jgi:hypothetical protein
METEQNLPRRRSRKAPDGVLSDGVADVGSRESRLAVRVNKEAGEASLALTDGRRAAAAARWRLSEQGREWSPGGYTSPACRRSEQRHRSQEREVSGGGDGMDRELGLQG